MTYVPIWGVHLAVAAAVSWWAGDGHEAGDERIKGGMPPLRRKKAGSHQIILHDSSREVGSSLPDSTEDAASHGVLEA